MSIPKYLIKKAKIQRATKMLLYKPKNQICAPKTPYEAAMLNRCDELYSPKEFISAFYGALKLHRERIDLEAMIKEVKQSRYKHFTKGAKKNHAKRKSL